MHIINVNKCKTFVILDKLGPNRKKWRHDVLFNVPLDGTNELIFSRLLSLRVCIMIFIIKETSITNLAPSPFNWALAF